MKTLLVLLLLIPSLSLSDGPVQDNLPPIDTETSVYMGDRMVEQRSGYFVECLVPNFDSEYINAIGQIMIIKKDVPMCKETVKSKKYTPPYINGLEGPDASWIVEDAIYEVKLREKNGSFKMCFPTLTGDAYCKENLSKKDFYFSKQLVSTKDSFQRVIEYGGKKGTIIKFIYSEFKDDMIRDAFMREFEIDLNDGNTVAYKGCVFEIIKVDNASITYKVIRHFQD